MALADPPITGHPHRRAGAEQDDHDVAGPARASSRPAPSPSRRALLLGIGLPLLVGLVHVALVWRRYYVGSFDDDSSYIMVARAFIAGHGLTSRLPSGAVLTGAYPPGYPALLVPLAWLWPHSFTPMRLLSVASFAALFPLSWWYLARRGLSFAACAAVLWLLALNPVLATYGSMVMAEAPFLVGMLVLLLLIEHWDNLDPHVGSSRRERLVTGTAVVLVAAAEVWLKEAGAGLVIGLALWQLWRRRPRRAVVVAAGTGLLLVPVVIARAVAGLPMAGTRYSQELGGYYSGGLAGRLIHVAPEALRQMVTTALPASVVPYLTPLPIDGNWPDVWKALSIHVSVLVLIGAVSWWRHHRDSATMVVGVYLAETLLWPFINERRVILVLPVVLAWYVIGAQAVWRWSTARLAAWRAARPRAAAPRRTAALGAGALVLVAVVGPLAVQFPRDYLFALGQHSSQPQGSRYVALLAHLGRPADVVETDYQSTIGLFSGHRTAFGAFVQDLHTCVLPASTAALASDGAGFLLLADLNKPGLIDSPCLAGEAATEPWAVPLLHSTRDNATVYELVGPGTAHTGLRNVTGSAVISTSGPPAPAGAGGGAATTAHAGTGWLEWRWAGTMAVSQVTVDHAGAGGATDAVSVQLQEPGRGWVTVASAGSGVGDSRGDAPYLLANLPAGTEASAVRVLVQGADVVRAGGVTVLGPAATR